MIAYTFLERGAVAPFSRLRWPLREWVHARVFACRQRDLPYWLHDELWTIELAGDLIEHPTQIEASRARLLERQERWNEEAARAFAADCALRARDASIAALEREGLRTEAARFAARAARSELAHLARDPIVAASPRAADLAGYVSDAALIAGGPAPNGASFVAAVAAVAMVGRESAYAEERAWQAALLRDRLRL
jgi:hypothetical protein